MSQLALVAMCNARHNLSERCAQWLMRFAHYLGSTIPITHAFLAEIIGVRRAGISTVLHGWQQERLISQGHGQITVLDQEGLRRKACTCPMIAATADSAISAKLLRPSGLSRVVGDEPVHPEVVVARQLSLEFAQVRARHLTLKKMTYGLLNGMLEGVTAMQGELRRANLGLRQAQSVLADT